jgi:hypothetical protein
MSISQSQDEEKATEGKSYGSKKTEQELAESAQDHIANIFLFYGRERDEASQWIQTSLRITRMHLKQSLLSEPQRWQGRYPTMLRKDIQRLLATDTFAALWYLNGGVEEKFKRRSWAPLNLDGAIRTGTLIQYLTPHPDDPERNVAENKIDHLRKELERRSKQVKSRKITLPFQLKTAPAWQLIKLGKKGKGNGHWVQPVNAATIPATEAELNAIREIAQSEFVTIEDDDDISPLHYDEPRGHRH